MSGVFYRVTGGEPLAFCLDFRERRAAVREQWHSFSEAQGAGGFVERWGFLVGLIFPYDAEIPAGWKAEKRKASDGSTIHSPAKRGDDGKAAKALIDALPREPLNTEFSDRFGIPGHLTYRKSENNWGSMVLNGVFPYTSFVAWAEDEFFVILPDIDAVIAEKVADGYKCEPESWAPPLGIERSSRAHYDLAVAKKRVAEEDAATGQSVVQSDNGGGV